MTDYVNPSTRLNGAKQIIVPRRGSSGEMQEAPFDDVQYVRENGDWVPIEIQEAPFDDVQYARENGDWVPIDFPDPPVLDLLPEPVVFLAVNGSESVTASSWTNVGGARNVPLSRALMAMVVLKGLPLGGASTWIRVRLSWTGATAGNSYTLLGNNFAGCLNGVGNTERDDSTLTFPLVLNAGTTTFVVQAQRQQGTATCSIADASIVITPIAWADQYDV